MSNALKKIQIKNYYLKLNKYKNRIIKKVFMLKFLYVAWIFNFYIFLANLSHNFKHVVLSRLDELLGLWYIIEKFQMSNFYPNFNRSKISPVALDISQTVHEGLVWYIWQY
jgi:hypothetical protein